MLYAVPQTDDPNETAMASMIARLRAAQPKPETIPLETSKPGTNAALAIQLAESIGTVCSALGDRITEGSVVVQWDGALDGACRKIAYRAWMNSRGRERSQGADTSIDANAEEALAYLARLRSPDREEQPTYVLSPGGVDASSPLLRSEKSAAAWTLDHRGGASFPPGWWR